MDDLDHFTRFLLAERAQKRILEVLHILECRSPLNSVENKFKKGIHKPRFQKENKKCTFFARFGNMQQADDLKVTCALELKFRYSIFEVYLHRLKDAQLRVQFVTSYALPNQKEIKARQSGNCNYYKDESGARFQRFPNQEQNQIVYLKRPETKEIEINVPSIQKPKIPRDMRENRNCLVNLKSEETARLCLPCSELGVPVIRQQELRGAGEHDLIPWQKMPDELRLEIPPEDFLVEITAPPFVDFDQQVSQTKNCRPKSANVTFPGMRAGRRPVADSL